MLWPHKGREWASLVPILRERLPVLTLGPYAPNERSGPAVWLRCAIAGTLPDLPAPTEEPFILYLPGVARSELRAVEDCPEALAPLAELQYRGAFWSHKNGRDWTVAAFLQAPAGATGGAGVEVATDAATRRDGRRTIQPPKRSRP